MTQLRFSKIAADQVVKVPGWFVWCGSMVRTPDGTCHLFLSMWEEKWGFEYGWATHSKVGYATCGEPGGRYEFRGVILEGSGVEGGFDRDSVHNPFAIWHKGRFYLYYSGNHGDGTYAVHTANQHVGLASVADPLGEWKRSDTPLFAPRPGAFDESGTTNPSVCRAPDGRFVMVYKCWSKEPLFNGRVSIGAAFADRPEGPWRRLDSPIFDAPGVQFAAEDPCVFSQGGRLHCLLKDMGSYYEPSVSRSIVCFDSDDGVTWCPGEPILFHTRELDFEQGGKRLVYRMERPFLYLENDRPQVFFTAVVPDEDKSTSFNVHMAVAQAE